MGSWIKIEEGETPDVHINLEAMTDLAFHDGLVSFHLVNSGKWTMSDPATIARIREYVERNQFLTREELVAKFHPMMMNAPIIGVPAATIKPTESIIPDPAPFMRQPGEHPDEYAMRIGYALKTQELAREQQRKAMMLGVI